MAIKTFSSGEVLTAADTNTYLTNSGLVYVTSGSLSGATTNFQNCFTATYNNYRIVIESMGTSGTGDFYLRLLQGSSETQGATANNYWAYVGLLSNGTTANSAIASSSVFFLGAGYTGANTASGQCVIDISSPRLTQKTLANVQTASVVPGAYSTRNGMCAFDLTSSFDGFAIKSLSAVTLSGLVTVYGYRKV